MKRMDKQAMIKTFKIFGTLTVIITLVGYFFGGMLEAFLEPAQSVPAAELPPVVLNDSVADDSTEEGEPVEVAEEVFDPTTFYMLQLGIFGSLDNAAALRRTLSELGMPADVIRLNGNFMLYSHVVGSRSQLREAENLLAASNVDYFVRQERPDSDAPGWQYFLLAANEQPFALSPDFINSFDGDMHIFGFYNVLSNTAFDPLSDERQNMLMAIYNWLQSN
ncbi:MAG: SPOR domain-containing protein [Turicibacter sp.]|nr:SPOR domain-containing protein [Turicibacter sp.]